MSVHQLSLLGFPAILVRILATCVKLPITWSIEEGDCIPVSKTASLRTTTESWAFPIKIWIIKVTISYVLLAQKSQTWWVAFSSYSFSDYQNYFSDVLRIFIMWQVFPCMMSVLHAFRSAVTFRANLYPVTQSNEWKMEPGWISSRYCKVNISFLLLM